MHSRDLVSGGDRRLTPAKMWLRALETTGQIGNDGARTLPTVVEELAKALGNSPALLSAGECLTYSELGERANRYSRWALGHGLTKGEVVCLLMPNRPEYLAIWAGITRVGGVVSLLNTNLVGDALLHAIGIVAPVHMIVDAQFAESIDGVAARLPQNVPVWIYGESAGSFARIDEQLESSVSLDLAGAEYRRPTIFDRALYIYTSGTTGLPKAANVSHFRLLQWSHWFAGMMDTRPDDRMYDCLPMYHSVGGVA